MQYLDEYNKVILDKVVYFKNELGSLVRTIQKIHYIDIGK